MNLFKKYGIKEVADVTFYSVIEIGDEELDIPVLVLDTLKVTDFNLKSTTVNANGGYGNKKVLSWSLGKEVTLTLTDALFSAASMSLATGWLQSNLSIYTSLISKINVANKYAKLNYSIYAYPSPKISEEEWETLFFILSNLYIEDTEEFEIFQEVKEAFNFSQWPDYLTYDFINDAYVSEIRTLIKNCYINRTLIVSNERAALPQKVIELIFYQIKNVSNYYKINSNNYKIESLDRMEKCVVTKEEGLYINSIQQLENLQKFFSNNTKENYTIYYDVKTMQPIVSDDPTIVLKKGTPYYKWTRTIQEIIGEEDCLGKTLVIDSNNFPQTFKIVGETYIREQKTNKDSRYQLTINRAKIAPETSLSFSADGEPSVFSMNINVLVPPNEIMVELKQFDVIEDKECGGTKILPQQSEQTKTNTQSQTYGQSGDINNAIIQ